MPMSSDAKIKSLKAKNLVSVVNEYAKKRQASHRYASFDYCYNYFHPSNTPDLTKEMEKSCLALGFYLASWGMFRGSSFLLERSVKSFVPVIDYVSSLETEIWGNRRL